MSNSQKGKTGIENHYHIPDPIETVYVFLMSHFEEEMAFSIEKTGQALVMIEAGLKVLDSYGQMGKFEKIMIKSMIKALESINESST